ncbi:MAG TPA: hypothetical protein VL995_03070 [Cellvibrio sp.]|nr:hypothetical protein [Cellvibrio sp.]
MKNFIREAKEYQDAKLTSDFPRCQNIVLFLTAVFAVTISFTSPAKAGKSTAECRAFADRSAAQLSESNTLNCGFPAGWNGTWQQNFDYCRSAESKSTDKIIHRRHVMMHMCKNVCRGYAEAAINDVRIATEGGCIKSGQTIGVTGPQGRWSDNYGAHFNWCMSEVSINREREIRATEAPRCGICGNYATTTVKLAQQQKQRKCGYDDFHSEHQWSINRDLHFQHCFGHPINMVSAWTNVQTNERVNLLNQCPSQQTQEMCRYYAARAAQQRKLLDNSRNSCSFQNLANSRWNSDKKVHYKGCLLNPESTPSEDQARLKHLLECGAIEKMSPPMVSTMQNKQCNFGVVTKLTECFNTTDGSPQQNWDPTSLDSACGLGESATEAEQNALFAYAAPGINLIVKKEAGRGECSYRKIATINACSCDTGTVRSGLGVRPSPSPADVMPRPIFQNR